MKSPFALKTHKSSSSAVGNSFAVSASGSGNQLGIPEMTLFHESSACRALLMERFDDVCSNILAQRISRNPYIQQTLLKLLPRLAAFNKERFMSK